MSTLTQQTLGFRTSFY